MDFLVKLNILIEGVLGLGLLSAPSLIVRALLGHSISGVSLPLARVAGLGFLSLGIACWPSGSGERSSGKLDSAFLALLTYNVLVTLYLLFLGVAGEFVGPLLWPAVALHAILTLLLTRQYFQF
jgi:hypothetical protein